MGQIDKAKGLLDFNTAIQPQLTNILEPLKLLGISNFAYGKITREQKYFRIGNHAAYTDLFFKLEVFNHKDAYRGFLNPKIFETPNQNQYFLLLFFLIYLVKLSIHF